MLAMDPLPSTAGLANIFVDVDEALWMKMNICQSVSEVDVSKARPTP